MVLLYIVSPRARGRVNYKWGGGPETYYQVHHYQLPRGMVLGSVPLPPATERQWAMMGRGTRLTWGYWPAGSPGTVPVHLYYIAHEVLCQLSRAVMLRAITPPRIWGPPWI